MTSRSLPWDWYGGEVPHNVVLGEDAYLETTYSFELHRSMKPVAVEVGRAASIYLGCMFDTGADATVRIGDFSLLHGVWLIADDAIEIGRHVLMSWNVVIMDTPRFDPNPSVRRQELVRIPARSSRQIHSQVEPSPVTIDDNVWIGFDCCILPGVHIGEGSVVGARSLVAQDVAPYSVVAGNPARFVRRLDRSGRGRHAHS